MKNKKFIGETNGKPKLICPYPVPWASMGLESFSSGYLLPNRSGNIAKSAKLDPVI